MSERKTELEIRFRHKSLPPGAAQTLRSTIFKFAWDAINDMEMQVLGEKTTPPGVETRGMPNGGWGGVANAAKWASSAHKEEIQKKVCSAVGRPLPFVEEYEQNDVAVYFVQQANRFARENAL